MYTKLRSMYNLNNAAKNSARESCLFSGIFDTDTVKTRVKQRDQHWVSLNEANVVRKFLCTKDTNHHLTCDKFHALHTVQVPQIAQITN